MTRPNRKARRWPSTLPKRNKFRGCIRKKVKEGQGNDKKISTLTKQPLPSSSLEHQDQSECLPIQKVDPGQDIPLDLEVFDEIKIEESLDDTTENIIFAEELDTGDIEKPKTCNSDNSRKRKRTSQAKSEKDSRPYIAGIKIVYGNIDKFGEQIAFVLKRIPKKLCRELQNTIVTLVKTATENHENKAKKNVTKKSNKVIAHISQSESSATLGNNTKNKTFKQLAVSIDNTTNVVMGECTADETVQATELIAAQPRTPPDQQFTSFPKPMTLPIEFFGSMDCVKQEPLDPGESNDIVAQEIYNETVTAEQTLLINKGIICIKGIPLNTNIKKRCRGIYFDGKS